MTYLRILSNQAVSWFLACALAVFMGSTAQLHSQESGLFATYYSNIDLTGSVVVQPVIPDIDFDFPDGVPYPGVPADFSARFTGYIIAPTTGTYTFSLTSDDGSRMWIDGNLVIDQWQGQAAETVNGSVTLKANTKTPIIIEYFNSHFGAVLQLQWSTDTLPEQVVPSSALIPEYFDVYQHPYSLPPPPANGFAVTLPRQAYLSPVFIEGTRSPRDTINVTSSGMSYPIHATDDTEFFCYVPLLVEGSTLCRVSDSHGHAEVSIDWLPIPLDQHEVSLEARVGDSIKVFAPDPSRSLAMEEIDKDGYTKSESTLSVPKSQQVIVTFDHVGWFRLKNAGLGGDGGMINVTVSNVHIPTRNACEIGYPKEMNIPIAPSSAGVVIQGNKDEKILISHYEDAPNSASFLMEPLGHHASLVARLRKSHAILDAQHVDTFTLTDDLEQLGAPIFVPQSNDIFTGPFGFTMAPVIDYTTIHIEFLEPYATVNGLSVFDIPAGSLPPDGHYRATCVLSNTIAGVYTCHRITVRQ